MANELGSKGLGKAFVESLFCHGSPLPKHIVILGLADSDCIRHGQSNHLQFIRLKQSLYEVEMNDTNRFINRKGIVF